MLTFFDLFCYTWDQVFFSTRGTVIRSIFMHHKLAIVCCLQNLLKIDIQLIYPFIQYATFYLWYFHSPNPIMFSSHMDPLPIPSLGAFGEMSKSGILALLSFVTKPLFLSEKADLIGCLARPFISLKSSHHLFDIGLFICDTRH